MLRKTALVLAVFLGAVLLRLPGLDSRPFHTDEANNALILEETLQQGGFQYRTHDHHGPTLFLLTASFCKILGIDSMAQMEAWALRLVTVIVGAAAAASVFLLTPYLNNFSALMAALIIAIGAPFHYYSRTFIHETLLLLLAIWLLAALLRWRDTGLLRWGIMSGLMAGLMVATKENAAISVAFIGLPFLLPIGGGTKIRPVGLLAAAIVGVAVILLFLGWENLRQAIVLHTQRGLGDEHNHPWYQFILWYGSWRGPGLPWFVWLMTPLAAWAVWRRNATVTLLALGFLGLFLFHAILPYKTPWLALVPLAWLALLGAIGLDFLLKSAPKSVTVASIALVTALMVSETWARSFTNQVRIDNPLAYSPTDMETVDLVREVDRLAALLPANRQSVIQVVAQDYWPLPWLLRKYPNKGYWQEPPEKWFGDILIFSPEAFGWLPDDVKPGFKIYELRPGVPVFVGSRHE